MTPSHEDQGTGFDPGASGFELAGRKSRPDTDDAAPESELPVTDARDDFAADPTDDPAQTAAQPASGEPPAVAPAKDGPKAPEPAAPASEAPTAPEMPPVAYPENHPAHPSRLPPAARPVRQGN